MINIFLSHSSEDISLSREIQKECKKRDIDLYMYQDDPRPGEYISEKLKNRIKKSFGIIVLITKSSLNSDSVKQEIGIAEGANKIIIPFVKRGLDTSSLLFLKGKEYIEFDPDDLAYSMDSVSAYIKAKFSEMEVAATKDSNENMDWGLILLSVLTGIFIGYSLNKN